ncbi:putative mitochondrial protein AtMg00310 [Apium graveolens]|uniref:putative mitochondrial protein AtMg00310 n=1 Tax=Apium graveolens TaxID=4045 RepID=UPI003D7A2BD3
MSWDRMAKHKSVGGLGFQNFRDYNIAMLGKQSWRFIVNPNSLVSRLYRAKYFASTDFINSKLGHSPSFVWRSISEAKQLLLDGTRWCIGNGRNIQIVGQPWLMGDENPFISTVSPAIKKKTVDALFCTERKMWDEEIVKDIFNPRDQECIFSTTLNEEDGVYWRLEDNGEYSVKSAFNLLQTKKGVWSADNRDCIWRSLWKIKAPQNI